MTPARPIYDREAVLNRWSAGETSEAIRAALKMTRPEAVRNIIQRARLKGDPRAERRLGGRPKASLSLGEMVFADLVIEAEARSLSPNELARRLLTAINDSNLYAAILDR